MKRLILGPLLAFLVVAVTGCPSSRAVDSTRLAESLTAGERQAQPMAIPGSLIGQPGTFVIPSAPGKNVRFRKNYPDGTPEITLETSRSEVLDMLLSGINEVDALKYAQDALWWDRGMQIADKLLQLASPFIQNYLNTGRPVPQPTSTSPPSSQPSLKQQLAQMLTDPSQRQELLSFLRDLQALNSSGGK